jgi:hypothetical protein
MPEATIDEKGVIKCGIYFIRDNKLWQVTDWEDFPEFELFGDDDSFEDLYQALHAWHMAQAYDKTYLAKVEQAAQSLKDDELYKPDNIQETTRK